MDANNFIPESDLPLLPEPKDLSSTQSNSAPPKSGQQPTNDSNNDGEKSFIRQRQSQQKESVLEQLEKVPIISYACDKVGISRATQYRWMDNDKDYKKAVAEAILNGKKFMNDMAENSLLSLVRDQSFPAISFWLKHNHPDYKNRLEITGKLNRSDGEPLTPEEEKDLQSGLAYAKAMLSGTDNIVSDSAEPAESDKSPSELTNLPPSESESSSPDSNNSSIS